MATGELSVHLAWCVPAAPRVLKYNTTKDSELYNPLDFLRVGQRSVRKSVNRKSAP